MADQIELLSDGDGLAVVGAPGAIERFLDSTGLRSVARDLGMDKLSSVLGTGAEALRSASDASVNVGRYVKLTKESAERVKEFGLMPTKTRGIRHAMVGDPGAIAKWIQIEDSPASLIMNPAVLSGAAGLMAQLARQQEARELRELLAAIDRKIDDVRRTQRDEVLAEMDRVVLAIKEAQAIHQHGGDEATAWQKLTPVHSTIGKVQSSALRALGALADKMDGQHSVAGRARLAQEVEAEVTVWIAVLARCFELQDEFAVLEIDHVLRSAPANLDAHRLGLRAALEERRDLVVEATTSLLERLDDAAKASDEHVLLHVRAARAVLRSANAVAVSVEELTSPLGVAPTRTQLTGTLWRDAAGNRRQLKNAGAEIGKKTALTAASIGVGALAFVAVKKGSSGEA